MREVNYLTENEMDDISFIRGFLGLTRMSMDECNFANSDNIHSTLQLIDGKKSSISFDYLLNLGNSSLADAKSIGFFNEGNVAAKIAKFRSLEEIIDDKTIILSSSVSKSTRKQGLVDVLKRRRSTRSFSPQYMSFQDFSEIINLSFGLGKREAGYGGIRVPTRHYGSGGGLYPIEIIIVVNSVDGVKNGAYYYQPYSNSIRPLDSDIKMERLIPHGDFSLSNSSFVVFYKYDINRNIEKYGELALSISLIEVGLMSQNLCLIYTMLGYSGCQVAGIDKHSCEKAFLLDGISSHILFADICGREF